MKKRNLWLAVLTATVLALVSCGQKKTTEYVLKARLEGLPNGVHVQLVPVGGSAAKPLADTVVTDGKFVFRGVAEELRAVRLVVKDSYGSCLLMLENTEITMTGKVTRTDSGQTSSYDFTNVRIDGSPATDKYLRLYGVRARLDSLYQADNERFADIRAAYGQARGTGNRTLMDSVRATEAYKASAKADSLFFATVEETYYRVVMDNKDSFWGPLMMLTLFSYLTEEQKPWYEAFSAEAKESYYGRLVKAEVDPDAQEGNRAPDFVVAGRDGREQTLAQLCSGRRYILIDFWASWCAPCRKEIPNLKKIYADYAEKGFQIVSISIDKKEAEWRKALEEEQLSWPNFLDTNGIADLYKVRFVPTMYLIDSEGIIVAENLRGEALAAKVAELFK